MNKDLDLPDHHADKKKHPNFAINGPCPYVRGDLSKEKKGVWDTHYSIHVSGYTVLSHGMNYDHID